MENIIFSQQQYQRLLHEFDQLKAAIAIANMQQTFLDNQEFIQLMNISKRTAQTWRDQGIIAFSQVGNKVYYRMADVQKLLDINYKPSESIKK